MNERIRQITVQAGLVRVGDFGMKRWEGARSDSITDQDLEKFAELIVKKCADVAHTHTPQTEECEYQWLIHNKIKEHFGVKE
jgi:hypothetical protein